MAGNNCIPQTSGINTINASNGVTVYNDPNPCSDHMVINYTLPDASNVTAVLYDECGREVQILFSDYSSTGSHSVNIDTHDLSQGMYYYTLHGDYFNVSGKCLVMR